MTRDYQFEIEGDRYDSIVEAIVSAVGAVRNESIADVDPLYAAIDPEALESILESDGDVAVRFEYAGQTVTVTSERTVRLEATTDSTRADPTNE